MQLNYKYERIHSEKTFTQVTEATAKNGNRIKLSLRAEDENSKEDNRHLAYDEQTSCLCVDRTQSTVQQTDELKLSSILDVLHFL